MKFLEIIWKSAQPQPFRPSSSVESFVICEMGFYSHNRPLLFPVVLIDHVLYFAIGFIHNSYDAGWHHLIF